MTLGDYSDRWPYNVESYGKPNYSKYVQDPENRPDINYDKVIPAMLVSGYYLEMSVHKESSTETIQAIVKSDNGTSVYKKILGDDRKFSIVGQEATLSWHSDCDDTDHSEQGVIGVLYMAIPETGGLTVSFSGNLLSFPSLDKFTPKTGNATAPANVTVNGFKYKHYDRNVPIPPGIYDISECTELSYYAINKIAELLIAGSSLYPEYSGFTKTIKFPFLPNDEGLIFELNAAGYTVTSSYDSPCDSSVNYASITIEIPSNGYTYILPTSEFIPDTLSNMGLSQDAEFTIDWGDGTAEDITVTLPYDITHNYSTAGQYVLRIGGYLPTIGAGDESGSIIEVNSIGKNVIGLMSVSGTQMIRFNANYGSFVSNKIENLLSGTSIDDDNLLLNFNENYEIESAIGVISSNNSIENIDLTGMNLSKTTDISYFISNSHMLKTIKFPNNGLPEVTNAEWSFTNCSSLKEFYGSLSMPKCTNYEGMLATNPSLTGLPRTISFDSCTNASQMISSTSSMQYLDLSDKTFNNECDLYLLKGGNLAALRSVYFKNLSGNITRLPKLTESGIVSLSFDGLNTPNLQNPGRYDYSTGLFKANLNGLSCSKVINDLSWMFAGCTNLSTLVMDELNTSNVTNIDYMLSGCSNLSTWDGIVNMDITSLQSAVDFLNGVTIPTDKYDQLLIQWAGKPHQNNVTIRFGNSVRSSASDDSVATLELDGWIIQDGT